MRRLLVVACAALALLVACANGDLRGAVAGGDDDVSMSISDSLDALPAVPLPQMTPPPASGGVFIELAFPPSRVAIADVFRPPKG